MGKIVEVAAFRGVDDANAFEIDVQFGGDLFHFRAVAKKNRRAEAKRIKLSRRLQHARLGAFGENHSLGMALEFFNDRSDKTHGSLVAEQGTKRNNSRDG